MGTEMLPVSWPAIDCTARRGAIHMVGLRRELDAGACVVGIEPSCPSFFHDELPTLFPDDPVAKRLSQQTMLLAEFLGKITQFDPPRQTGRALMYGHCHHNALSVWAATPLRAARADSMPTSSTTAAAA